MTPVAVFLYSIALLLVGAISFYCGVRLSDRYHDTAAYEQKAALQKQFARLTAGVDADDPSQPYVFVPSAKKRRFSADQNFVDRLRANGSATVAVNKPKAG